MNEDATLRPVPETTEALAEVISLEDEPELDEVLLDMGRKAREIAPDIVALSLTLLQKGLTFTLVASSLGAAGLDAAQYLDDDGPCLRAVDEGEMVESRIEELLDEGQWQTFARSSAALGVASSLSMPTVKDGRVTGGINLYASTAHAFAGHQQALAEALGASAADAVANADLSFSTRRQAVEAPARMRASTTSTRRSASWRRRNWRASRRRGSGCATRRCAPEWTRHWWRGCCSTSTPTGDGPQPARGMNARARTQSVRRGAS